MPLPPTLLNELFIDKVNMPSVHCPHIGPSGGGYCTDDLTYEGVVTQPYFTNQPMVPYGYANANPSIAAL